MIYNEIIGDLFTASSDNYLVQCISADFACGAGIAVSFNKYFDVRNILKSTYGNDYLQDYMEGCACRCLQVGRVFNLITKERCWHKPTYQSLQAALNELQCIITNKGIAHIAMPLIGCGIDGLCWETVSAMIQNTFRETNVTITVYKLA